MPRRTRLCWILATFALSMASVAGVAAAAPPPARAAKPGSVAIFAALLDSHLEAHPVPLLAIVFVSDRGDTVRARTAIDGRTRVTLAPGRWALSTPYGVTMEDRHASWNLTLTVPYADGPELVLGNDNATLAAISPPASREPEPLSARDLYARLGGGVFRVQAGLVRGTAFLADTLGGVLLTNAHVVEPGAPDNLSVFLDDSTRVPAALLAIDSEADAAALLVAAPLLAGRPRLRLLAAAPEDAIHVGDPLAALGYPLNQSLVVTSGIASSVRPGAVLSDVNLNPGNSGGPLVDARGEVVAINTFLDTGPAGPGISGSIAIPRLSHLLSIATARDTLQRPEARVLPVAPSDRIALEELKLSADKIEKKRLDQATLPCGRFVVSLRTPYLVMAAVKAHENDVAKDRKKREERSGLPEIQRYSEVREYRDWAEYVGAQSAPVVSVTVVPNASETSGSVFARMLVSPLITAKMRFEGDVRDVLVLRDGEPCAPILSGHTPLRMDSQAGIVSFKDVADEGHCVLPLEVLRPDSLGLPPSIVVAVRDLKHPKKWSCVELPSEAVAAAWNDFEPWLRGRTAGTFAASDPERAKHRKPAWRTGVLKGESEWAVGTSGHWP